MKIPFKIKLTKSNNERVVTKMQMFEVESGSLIKSDSTIKSQVFGKKDVNFTPVRFTFINTQFFFFLTKYFLYCIF